MPRLAHKRGRKSSYTHKLNNPEWQDVARQVRLRDHHTCQVCGSKTQLEVHHKTYYHNGESIVGSERHHLDKLVTLCSKCHKKTHSKWTLDG